MSKKSGVLAGRVDGAAAQRRILMDAVTVLAAEVGVARACAAMHVPRSSVYRADARQRHLLAPTPRPAPRPAAPLALSQAERATLLDTLNSDRFANRAPPTVYATSDSSCE